MLVAGKFAWVPHVKLPVKCLWYSGKLTCARRKFACVLREVLAASKQVNLPVFTGKLHVTHVNCARHLFTCELQVKLPAFAGNFARASFTVYISNSSLAYCCIKGKLKYHSTNITSLKKTNIKLETQPSLNWIGSHSFLFNSLITFPYCQKRDFTHVMQCFRLNFFIVQVLKRCAKLEVLTSTASLPFY